MGERYKRQINHCNELTNKIKLINNLETIHHKYKRWKIWSKIYEIICPPAKLVKFSVWRYQILARIWYTGCRDVKQHNHIGEGPAMSGKPAHVQIWASGGLHQCEPRGSQAWRIWPDWPMSFMLTNGCSTCTQVLFCMLLLTSKTFG
jgi:hypothetical protein